jgi:hypothetical protein
MDPPDQLRVEDLLSSLRSDIGDERGHPAFELESGSR